MRDVICLLTYIRESVLSMRVCYFWREKLDKESSENGGESGEMEIRILCSSFPLVSLEAQIEDDGSGENKYKRVRG